MDVDEFAENHRFVLEKAALGEVADFSQRPVYDLENKPRIRADFVRRLMLGLEGGCRLLLPGVRIKGAFLEGVLDLTDCTGAGGTGLPALALTACDLPSRIDLSNARVARLSIDHSRFREMWALGVKVDGDLEISHATPAPRHIGGDDTAYIRIGSAYINGNIWGDGAVFVAPNDLPDGMDELPKAFNLQLAKIDGVVGLAKLACTGCLWLPSAHVGGIILDGAKLKDKGGSSLVGNGLTVRGGCSFAELDGERFEAEGTIFLNRAQIGGNLDFSGARLFDAEGDALSATDATIGANVTLSADDARRFESFGQVSFRGAKVVGDFWCEGGAFINQHGFALQAIGIQIGGGVSLSSVDGFRFLSDGTVCFRDAVISNDFACTGAAFNKTGGTALDLINSKIAGIAILCSQNDQRFEANGVVDLRRAKVGSLDMSGALLKNGSGGALGANACEIMGDVFLCATASYRFEAQGAVELIGTQIGGTLSCSGGFFNNPGGVALKATLADIGGAALLTFVDGEYFQSEGLVDFSSTRVRGAFVCDGGTFSNPEGVAFSANGIVVGSHLMFGVLGGRRVEIEGVTTLSGAKIEGSLFLDGAKLTTPKDVALNASNIEVRGGVHLSKNAPYPFEAEGMIYLGNAKIGQGLSLYGAKIQNHSGFALMLGSAAIDGQFWAYENEIDGAIDLGGSRIDQLIDDPDTGWGSRKSKRLIQTNEITINRLDVVTQATRPLWKARKDWLRSNTQSLSDGGHQPFSNQPWRVVATAYQRAGAHQDARRIRREEQREANRHRRFPASSVVWLIGEFMFGYGLSVLRPAVTLAALWLVGTLGVVAMEQRGVLLQAETPHEQCRSIQPALYALDTLVPVLDLRQESACDPAGKTTKSTILNYKLGIRTIAVSEVAFWQWAKSLYAVAGAFLTGFAILTWSGVFAPRAKE